MTPSSNVMTSTQRPTAATSPPIREMLFLGIDAGSTTTKAALVGEDGSLLYCFYHNNNGSPLATAIRAIKEIYSNSCRTGAKIVLLLLYRLRRSPD